MSGLTFAAPVSGENRQSVQLADLDGDGQEEYVVFAKGTSENPLQILIFRQPEADQYELLASISCKGGNFDQVMYAEFDDQPGCELIIGRQINDQVTKIASVYSFQNGQATQILSSLYAKLLICDLDGNGSVELLVVRSEEGASSGATAVAYGWEADKIVRSVEVSLSRKADQIRRITVNRLIDGETAVYIASTSEDSSVFTDVLAMKDDVLVNVIDWMDAAPLTRTLRNYSVFAQDIDGDGVLELPTLIPMRYMTASRDEPEQNLIRWNSLALDGTLTEKCYTFHNFSDGWYLELEKSMLSRIAAEENGNAFIFYMWNDSYGEAMAVFSVFALTGNDRNQEVNVQNRFPLYRGESTVYAGKLETASAVYGITEEYLQNSFHLISQEWKMGEK